MPISELLTVVRSWTHSEDLWGVSPPTLTEKEWGSLEETWSVEP